MMRTCRLFGLFPLSSPALPVSSLSLSLSLSLSFSDMVVAGSSRFRDGCGYEAEVGRWNWYEGELCSCFRLVVVCSF